MSTSVSCSIADGGVGLVRLNRPDRLNAMNPDLLASLREKLGAFAQDDEVRAIVITGSGKGFCAGADLVSFLSKASEGGSIGQQVADSMELRFNPVMAALLDFPKPVVCAVNGVAAGGGAALALCADIVLAARSATLKFVQVQQLGCVADLGANWLMSRCIGRAAALGAILLGDAIEAEAAQRLGLIWQVVADEELLDRSLDVARKLAAVPKGLIPASRRLIDAGATMAFRDMLDLERLNQVEFTSRPELVKTIGDFMSRKAR